MELGFYIVDNEKFLRVFLGRGIDICKVVFEKIGLVCVGRLDWRERFSLGSVVVVFIKGIREWF